MRVYGQVTSLYITGLRMRVFRQVISPHIIGLRVFAAGKTRWRLNLACSLVRCGLRTNNISNGTNRYN